MFVFFKCNAEMDCMWNMWDLNVTNLHKDVSRHKVEHISALCDLTVRAAFDLY